MTRLQRIRLFTTDLLSEIATAWSVARTHDCERNGGHRWGKPARDDPMPGYWKTCSRCGCGRSVEMAAVPIYPTHTTHTTASYAFTLGDTTP